MSIESRRQPDPLTVFAGALLGLAILLHLRRYAGITHDSMLYFGQALMAHRPDIFSKDLFFLFGSQANFSLFPWLAGQLFDWFPAPMVFLWGTLFSLLLFAAAGWYCLQGLLPKDQRLWAWLGVLCLPSRYAITELFSYSEQFFTSRPFAEALCLFGIGFLIRRYWIFAAICAALAASLHPLQACAALLIVWPWLLLNDRRWLHLFWLALPVCGLAAFSVGPFTGLFQQIDPEWLSKIQGNTRQMFLGLWGASDFWSLGFDVLLLAYGWRALQGSISTWCAAALWGLVLGFSANLILVDSLHLVLPAGLQLWRVHWLAHWFAMVSLALLLLRDARNGDWSRILLLMMTAQLAWTMPIQTWAPLALLYGAWTRLFFERRYSRLRPLLGFLFGIGMALLFANYVSSDWFWFRLAHYRLDIYAMDHRLLAFPAITLGLPALGIFFWNKCALRGRLILFAFILCPLTVIGALRWDSRPWINRAFENSASHPTIFGTEIPESAQVYWDPETFLGPWMVLTRASYYSGGQLGGGGFNRQTSIEGNLRAARMITLIRDSNYCQDRDRSTEDRKHCHISDLGMERACAPGLGVQPDYLVLQYLQHQKPLGTWQIRDPVTMETAAQYWLYSCESVMRKLLVPRPLLTD